MRRFAMVWVALVSVWPATIGAQTTSTVVTDAASSVPQDRRLDFPVSRPDNFREVQFSEFQPDCPDGAQAASCLPQGQTERFGSGSWVRMKVKPYYARVYVNRTYVGTAQQFEAPYRGLRIGQGPTLIEFRAPGYKQESVYVMQMVDRITDLARELKPTSR